VNEKNQEILDQEILALHSPTKLKRSYPKHAPHLESQSRLVPRVAISTDVGLKRAVFMRFEIPFEIQH
jgi:hypothetical protein